MRLKRSHLFGVAAVLAAAVVIWTLRPRNPFREIEAASVAEMHIQFMGRPPEGYEGEGPTEGIIGVIPPNRVEDILVYLRNAKFDPTPAKWAEMAQLKITFKDGSQLAVALDRCPEGIAFQSSKRVYFRAKDAVGLYRTAQDALAENGE